MEENRKYSGFAITSFVLGIISFFIGWLPIFGWIIIALAIIFGFISLSRIKKNNLKGKGLAITGIILGFVSLVFIILVFSFFLSLLSMTSSNNSTIGKDASEILAINNNCKSRPAMIPVSCDAATGEVMISVKEYFEGKNFADKTIFSTLFLIDDTKAYSSFAITSPLQQGQTIVVPAPDYALTSRVKSAKIQYDLCGNVGCIGCTEIVTCN